MLFHTIDEEMIGGSHSEDTPRYKIGFFCYFVMFSVQIVMLVGTYIAAWIIYIRLTLFLKPEKPTRRVGPEG